MPGDGQGAIARARADIAEQRLWKARDRLTSLVIEQPANQDALGLLGEVHYAMGDLPSAGRYWLITERSGPDVDAALNAFEDRWGHHLREKLKMVPARQPVDAYPAAVQARIRELENQGRTLGLDTWPPPKRSSKRDREGLSGESSWFEDNLLAPLLILAFPGIWVLGCVALIYVLIEGLP